MKTVHTTTIVAKCPTGCPDVYAAEFEVTDHLLRVEKIQEAIDALTKEPLYQEALTQRLADRLNCTVTTRGTHQQFHTVCTAEPK